METPGKLKPVKWELIFALILIHSIIIISLFAILDTIFDKQTKLNVYGYTWLAFAAFNLILWLFRKDLVSMSFILINLTMAISYLTDYKGVYITLPIILLYSVYAYFIYVNYKSNAHYRQLLELAAKPVNDIKNGFTSRPMVVGQISADNNSLYDFATFLKKNFIAFPYFDYEGIVLTIKDHKRFWFGRPNEKNNSYVFLGFDQNIAVNIAKKDYLKYKEEYTFDELCASLGNIFKQFFKYYHAGQKDKILEMLDS